MTLTYLPGPIILAILTAAMMLAVPVERIRRLLPYGIIFGAGLGLIIIFLFQNLLGYWSFHRVDLLNAGRIPVLLALCWLPAEILFAHFMIELRSAGFKCLLWLLMGAAVVGLHYLFITNRLLTFTNWNLLGTFLLTLFIHAGLVVVLHLFGYLKLQDLLKSS